MVDHMNYEMLARFLQSALDKKDPDYLVHAVRMTVRSLVAKERALRAEEESRQ